MLAPLQPEFVSVTYGAGGTTRKLTHEAVTTIARNTGLKVAAHLTCVDATKAETLEIAAAYAAAGITDIVALRGDAPKGATRFTPHPEGFADSVELIEALAATGKFTLRVGAYPEPHPDAADTLQDVRWLKRKLDAGATAALTQFFFEPETFLRFRDLCAKEGITAPIIPGILPIDEFRRRARNSQPAAAPWCRNGSIDAFAVAKPRRARGPAFGRAVHRALRPADFGRGRGSALLHPEPPAPDP